MSQTFELGLRDESVPSICDRGNICPAYPRYRHPEDIREQQRQQRREPARRRNDTATG